LLLHQYLFSSPQLMRLSRLEVLFAFIPRWFIIVTIPQGEKNIK